MEKEGKGQGNLPPLKFRFGYGTAYDPPFLKIWVRPGSNISSERPSSNIWLATGLFICPKTLLTAFLHLATASAETFPSAAVERLFGVFVFGGMPDISLFKQPVLLKCKY